MADDRRTLNWGSIALTLMAAVGGAYGTSELLYRSAGQQDERMRWEDAWRATTAAQIKGLEEDVRMLRDAVIRCEVSGKYQKGGR
jgi:hypothetical protein